MKKLLLFSLLSVIAIPAIAMQPTRVNVPTEHTPGLYIHPIAAKFTGNDAPMNSAVNDMIFDTSSVITERTPDSYRIETNPTLISGLDHNGRNLIWWAALIGSKKAYNSLIAKGANPDVKSTSGILAGFSARQLNDMSQDDIQAYVESGATKAKL